MTKGQKVGLTMVVVILVGAGIATLVYLQKKKKDSDVLDLDKIDSDDIPETTKNKIPSHVDYDTEKVIKELKDDMAKAYYAMEIMENRGGVVYNTKTGNPVANGLDQGIWIQLKKRKNEFLQNVSKDGQSNDLKQHGFSLINKLNKDIDAIFSPTKYNTKQAWFKEYITKYPEGIKGKA